MCLSLVLDLDWGWLLLQSGPLFWNEFILNHIIRALACTGFIIELEVMLGRGAVDLAALLLYL